MRKTISLFLLFALFFSCSPEWKLSRQFVHSDLAGKVLILPSDEIYFENNRMDTVDYQLSIDNSILLREIQDSSFLQAYYNQLIEELIALKVNVYLDEMEAFQDSSQGILLNIEQIVIEESAEEQIETSYFSEGTYYKTLDLNRIDLDFWFEISLINRDLKPIIAFDSEYLTDKSEGYFYQNFLSGEVYYEDNITPLAVDDIYQAAKDLGRKHAQMFYDILLNRYIENNYPSDESVKFLMHYNADRKFLEPIYNTEDLFQIIE